MTDSSNYPSRSAESDRLWHFAELWEQLHQKLARQAVRHHGIGSSAELRDEYLSRSYRALQRMRDAMERWAEYQGHPMPYFSEVAR